MAKVTLDRETFKALASETRLDVLHALDDRRKTGSELARELALNKATVHEHLNILLATGLVEKQDEGRKWIYWRLTWEGNKLLHPEQGTSFSILLGLSALATGGGLIALGKSLQWWLASEGAGQTEFGAPAGDGAEELSGESDDSADTSQQAAAEPTEAEAPPDAGFVADADSADSGVDFFADGGWYAISFLFTAVLCIAMAIVLRRSK